MAIDPSSWYNELLFEAEDLQAIHCRALVAITNGWSDGCLGAGESLSLWLRDLRKADEIPKQAIGAGVSREELPAQRETRVEV